MSTDDGQTKITVSDAYRNLTIKDLSVLVENVPPTSSVKNALPKMKEWASEHNLTDKEALKAYGVALMMKGKS